MSRADALAAMQVRIDQAHGDALIEDTERLAAQMRWSRIPRAENWHRCHHQTPDDFLYNEMGSFVNNGGEILSEFHVNGGITFGRLTCGCVVIFRWEPVWYVGAGLHDLPGRRWRRETVTIITPDAFASVVCSVSRDGETGERWEAMRIFHGIDADRRTEETGR